MAKHLPGNPDARDRFVRLDDGDMHMLEDGKPGAPAVLLMSRATVAAACSSRPG